MRALAIRILVSIALLTAVTASAAEHFHPKGKGPSAHTMEKIKRVRTTLPFAD